ncbi:UNVERIFIED_CONTAM: hypothetical protein Slati_0892100 [Sesamum latifolium]|uniref:Uncharacterized protein n=1 Tax=Sesamum latifolium TaxID=2727402 RepID=A0AAW2XNQ4_9LAMI
MAFIMPKGIIWEVEKRLRTFLWKGHSGGGYAKVAWSHVCHPKEEGGLGIRNILALIKALMSKHLWWIITQDQTSIWVGWPLLSASDRNLFGQLVTRLARGDGGSFFCSGHFFFLLSSIGLVMESYSLFGRTLGTLLVFLYSISLEDRDLWTYWSRTGSVRLLMRGISTGRLLQT